MKKSKKKGQMRKLWTVTGRSESGNDYGVMEIFDHKPSQKELMTLVSYNAVGNDGYDVPGVEQGPGSFGSYIHLDIEESEDRL